VPAIYIIVALLVVLFLIGAYRAMGAGATTQHDPGGVLKSVLAGAGDAARALGGTPGPDDARANRRRLEGCAQALEGIAGAPGDEHLDEARSLLEHAVDELTWAARLAEAPGHATDPAVQAAATSLRDAASAKLERARALLGV
jgi:hypothetical protein